MSDVSTQTWRCLRCKTEFIESGGGRYDPSPRRVHCPTCKTVTRQERTP
jgi:DNA-directed RNA polymerase subunit RPC12/RpoP